MKNHVKVFSCIQLDIKFYVLQNGCLLVSIKNGCIKDYIGSKYLILISADGEGKGLLTKYNKCLIQLSLLLRKKG